MARNCKELFFCPRNKLFFFLSCPLNVPAKKEKDLFFRWKKERKSWHSEAPIFKD